MKREETTFIHNSAVHKTLLLKDNHTQNFVIDVMLHNGYNDFFGAGQLFKLAAEIWSQILSNTQVSAPIYINTNFIKMPAGLLGNTDTTNVIFSCHSEESREIMRRITKRNGINMPRCDLNLNFMLPEYSIYQRGFDINKAQMKSLGMPGTDQYFGAQDGMINVNTRYERHFDFDLSDGVDRMKTDFLSFALHEIGHLLGFKSAIDKVDQGGFSFNPTILDVFRFANWRNADFNNDFRVADGRESDHFIINPLMTSMNNERNKFSTGVYRGDGNQASHWKADELTRHYLGIFDPTLGKGKHMAITKEDIIALRMIGYDVNITSKPSIISARTVLLNFETSKRAIRFMAELIFSEDLLCIVDNEFQYSANFDIDRGNYWCPYDEDLSPKVFEIKTILTNRRSDKYSLVA